MRSRSVFTLVLVVAAFCVVGIAGATVPNRISGAVSDAAMVAQRGGIHPKVKLAVDNGRLNAATPLPALSLNFAPSAAQQAALDALLTAQQTPGSPSYHQWLTQAQFGAHFGMSDGDLATVTAWLQSRGFTVERVAPSRNAIHFSGSADQVERAFHTELHALTLDGEAHFANTTEPSLPAAFAATITSIGGLNNFHLKPHARASARQVSYTVGSRKVNSSPMPFAVDPSTSNEYVAPEDFAKIYDVTALYNAGFNGSASYPIGIIGETAVYTADLTAFRTAFGLSTTNLPTMVLEPNTGSSAVTNTDDLSESELDLEWADAVAPGASIYFVYTGNSSSNGSYTYGVFDALQYAIQTYTVNGKPLPILSISYGECEPSDTPTNLATYETWFKQANAQGQTILSASGDEGAAGCDYATNAANGYAATLGLAVDYPSSSAYVTGVGGTSFSGDLTAKATYWGATNDNNYGNELGLYIPSSTWNDTSTVATATSSKGLSASGGGVSALWPKPYWQSGVPGIPSDGKRDVPDIALSADPDHDGFLVCINSSCAGNNGYFNVYGGTSVAAPSFAGILAIVEQKLAANQGNLNPSLYSIGSTANTYASAFHDITVGSNIVPCVVSLTDTGCTGGSMGYASGAGYDLVTGLGAPDAANLASALAVVVRRITTTESLASTPSTPSTSQTVNSTATIATSSLTTPPTGSVLFTVDGAASGTTVPLSSSGAASFPATFTTGGPHTVSAVYSGDTNYYGSSATSTVNLTVPSTGSATTTAVIASPTSIAVGGTLTLTANVSSATPGTITGQVSFATGAGTALGNATVVNGSAILAVPVALAKFAVGGNTITATYDGDTSHTPSTSQTPAAITVTNPSITLSATNITVASGGNGSSTITITSGGNYAGNIALTASTTTTLNGSYTFTPATVTIAAGGNGTSTFTLTGVTASAAPGSGLVHLGSGVAGLVLGGGVTFAGLLLFGIGGIRRKRLASLLTVMFVFAGLMTAMGCGSSSSSAPAPVTPKTGTYVVTITGTDTSTSTISNTATLTVTVQ